MKKFTFLVAALTAVVFSANAEVVFIESFGPPAAKVGDYWPAVAAWDGFDNKAPITFAAEVGDGLDKFVSIRWVMSLPDPYGTHVYMAANKTSSLLISNIPAAGKSGLTMSFELASHEKTGGSSDLVKVFVNGTEATVPTVTIPGDNSGTVVVPAFPITGGDVLNIKIASTNAIGIRVDNIKIESSGSGVAEEVAAQLNLFVSGNVVNFTTEQAVNVAVYSMTGAQVFNKVSTIGANSIKINNSGLYIVKVGTKAIMVRI